MDRNTRLAILEESHVFFLELALSLNGAIQAHRPSDEFVRCLTKSFAGIFRDQVERVKHSLSDGPVRNGASANTHPAVEELMELISQSFVETAGA